MASLYDCLPRSAPANEAELENRLRHTGISRIASAQTQRNYILAGAFRRKGRRDALGRYTDFVPAAGGVPILWRIDTVRLLKSDHQPQQGRGWWISLMGV